MCAQKPFVSYIRVPLYSLYCTFVQDYTALTVFIFTLCSGDVWASRGIKDLNKTNNVNIAHLGDSFIWCCSHPEWITRHRRPRWWGRGPQLQSTSEQIWEKWRCRSQSLSPRSGRRHWADQPEKEKRYFEAKAHLLWVSAPKFLNGYILFHNDVLMFEVYFSLFFAACTNVKSNVVFCPQSI